MLVLGGLLEWLLDALGFNGETALAVILLFVAFELVRGRRMASRAGGVLGGALMYVVVAVVVIALGTILGWWDLNPATVVEQASTAGEILLSWLADQLAGVLGEVAG